MDLSRNFTLEEMPCYQHATPQDVAALQDTVSRVLQPVRDVWGPTVVTSWRWWRDGCRPRDGAHAGGGTVDFVVPGRNLYDVFLWGLATMDRSYVGRWIYEPTLTDPTTGQVLQEEHIHVAPIADMVAEFGPSKGDSLAAVEGPQNVYTPVPGWGGASGSITDPIEIEGLTVTVSPLGSAWLRAIVAGLVLGWLVAEAGKRGGGGLSSW